VTLISAASQVLSALRHENVKGCIVEGLAVSVRCDPRFTRDVDIAVVVDTDEHADAKIHMIFEGTSEIQRLSLCGVIANDPN
jgi:alkylation response protein AidB-like acyl-CoA dehydrogenase